MAGTAISSEGITGLKATLKEGTLINGIGGDLIYDVTGTANASGNASFSIDFRGQNCVVLVPVETQKIPSNITLGAADPYYIVSIYDNSTGKLIDVQGSLITAGVTINIPYTVTGASVNLPVFKQVVKVDKSVTEEGIQDIDISLSYSSRSLSVGTGFINATLKAESKILNVKKLPLSFLNQNPPYLLITNKFLYPKNSTTTQTFEVRDIPGIPDRNFADVNHKFLYVPIISNKTGKTWLNNNLGADYAKVGGAYFNPVQQAVSVGDFKAYGSLYQWGRYSDGHELMTWTNSTTGSPLNSPSTGTSSSSTVTGANYNRFLSGSNNWYTGSNALWQGVNGINNPCPDGYRVPTEAELTAEIIDTTGNIGNNNTLHFTLSGTRFYTNGGLINSNFDGDYWNSTINGIYSRYRKFAANGRLDNYDSVRTYGSPIRCVKN